MSDINLDEIKAKVEKGELADATGAIFTKLFEVIVKQELALRRIVLVLDEDSDLRKRIREDGFTASNHGAPDYQGTTLQDVLEWAKMGLE
jgi:hypothetical protein